MPRYIFLACDESGCAILPPHIRICPQTPIGPWLGCRAYGARNPDESPADFAKRQTDELQTAILSHIGQDYWSYFLLEMGKAIETGGCCMTNCGRFSLVGFDLDNPPAQFASAMERGIVALACAAARASPAPILLQREHDNTSTVSRSTAG
jgi:hypothetical protein